MKKILFFLFFINVCEQLSAQVNLPTGSATFSLPLFNWNDDQGKLNSVVSINYNSGNGLKVTDVASDIGQGWNLIAGGQITRMVAGEPDDQKPSGDGTEPENLSKYPPGYLYRDPSAPIGCHNELTKYPLFKDKNHIYKQYNSVVADKELDRFSFQFNGRGGLFVLSRNGTGILLGDSKLKITYTTQDMAGIRTTINSFSIQDENGLTYTFSELAYSKVLKTDYCDASANIALTQPDFKNGQVYHESSFESDLVSNPYIVNGWYLTQVKDVLTGRIINITYNRTDVRSTAGTSLSYYAEKNYSLITHLISFDQNPQISTINYPDGHQVIFNYGAVRADLPGAFILSSIDILYEGRYVSKYQLTTSYFMGRYCGIPTSPYQNAIARLCLKSVQKIGVDLTGDDPPYIFDYYMGSNANGDLIPPPFSLYKDIWGYYNGSESKDIHGTSLSLNASINDLSVEQLMGLCFLRQNASDLALNPNNGYAKNGLLKKITYPAGGFLTYEYEQNYGKINNVERAVGGVHVSRVSLSAGAKLIDCEDNTIITDYSYTTAFNTTESSLWGLEKPVNTIGMTSAYYEPEGKHYHWGLHHCGILGCCKYRYQYPGIMSREQTVDLTGHQKFMEGLDLVLNIVSVLSTIMDVVTAIGSWGPQAIVAIVIDVILGIATALITCLHDYSKSYYSTVMYNSDMNGLNPLPVQFKRVEIKESSGNNGSTVMEFSSPDDYAIWETSNPLYSMKQRFAYWAYGLLKKKTVYSQVVDPVTSAPYPVSQTQNDYDFTTYGKKTTSESYLNGTPISTSITSPSCKCLATYSQSQSIINWQNPNDDLSSYTTTNIPGAPLRADIYQVYTGRVELLKTTERKFKNNSSSEYIETVTQYNNDPHNFLPNEISTVQSNGDKSIKTIVYSGDSWQYGSNQYPELPLLAVNNLINVPIVTRNTLTKAGGSQTYDLNETVTKYGVLNNGDIKPISISENRHGIPSLVGSTPYFNGLSFGNYKSVQFISYDGAGNIISTRDEGQHIVSSIYDYNNKFIIASIVNADQVLPKEGSCYSSFETDQFGNWELGGPPVYTSDVSITGQRSFILNSSNDLHVIINSGRTYLLSFWGESNTVTISNSPLIGPATLVKSGPTINGLTYYEYSLPAVQGTVKIEGNTTIDELRLYPATARMRTTTYDPLIGKTAECDENNRITYYEYDKNGRLRFIKDEHGNITKMYEYNYAQSREDNAVCNTTPTVYTNPEITEIYNNQFCPKGSIGAPYVYTIPAGTYTSTISQDIVDQMVQNDLEANGQNAANQNGNCIPHLGNLKLSQDFTKEGCDVGYTGTTITYTVPANTYFASSVEVANQLAQDEINANGQGFANFPGNAECVIDYEADYIGTGNTNCVNGHLMVEVYDQNPNSATYSDPPIWVDYGPTVSCGSASPPAPPEPPMVNLTSINQGNTAVTVELIEISSLQPYSFMIPPNTTTQAIVGQVPAGTYSVQITLPFGSTALNVHFYSSQQTGGFYSASVNISAAANPIISITN